MFKKLKLIVCIVLTIGITQQAFSQQLYYVGIPTENFNYYTSSQRNSNWCWAASIQMILNYNGVNITQEQIVEKSYGKSVNGTLPNWTGSFNTITKNLNNWIADSDSEKYKVTATLNYGAPTPAYLIQELTAQHPVLIGYQTSATTGHAVVVTACSYTQGAYGPVIQSIVVRDPWPNGQNANGRVEYSGISLASVIQAHWYVRVE
jgi:hypothetical protein